MTYSIVARDPETGALGVAVETCMFAGGSVVTWARAGVGAALATLPGEENFRFLRAGALAATGDIDGARAEMRALIAARPTWEVVVRSFAAKGLMAMPQGVTVDSLLA